MPVTITIRNVPDDTRASLAARADEAGQSMQEYLRALLIEQGSRRSRAQIFQEIQGIWARRADAEPAQERPEELVRGVREERTQLIIERAEGKWRDA